MKQLKITRSFYFTVEGETEQWYLTHLRDLINNSLTATCYVSFNHPKQKNPLSHVKALSVPINTKMEIWHLTDYESDEPTHVKDFTDAMDNMKKAQSIGKNIKYKFGYCNFAFDLWIVLHKADCNGTLTHRKNYLKPINDAYKEKFTSMDNYKKEDNFKRCLKKIEIEDVIAAITRAKVIMKNLEEHGYKPQQYKGYKYYKENPSLAIWEIIEKILMDCELISKHSKPKKQISTKV